MIAFAQQETCLCRPQSVDRMPLQSEIYLLQVWSMDVQVLGGFLCLDCEYCKQSSQFRINLLSCSFMPGQYTVSFALV